MSIIIKSSIWPVVRHISVDTDSHIFQIKLVFKYLTITFHSRFVLPCLPVYSFLIYFRWSCRSSLDMSFIVEFSILSHKLFCSWAKFINMCLCWFSEQWFGVIQSAEGAHLSKNLANYKYYAFFATLRKIILCWKWI